VDNINTDAWVAFKPTAIVIWATSIHLKKKNQRSQDGDQAGVNEVLCWGSAVQEKKTEAGMVQYMHG
jgi:hypothetical protein